MALQKDLTLHGVSVTGAYHRVHFVSGGKSSLSVDIRCYKDATEAADESAFLDEFAFELPGGSLIHDDGASDKNYIKQAYEYMKANPITDYSGVSHDYTTGTTDV